MVTFCDTEEAMRDLIVRYQQKVYALCLYLLGGDADKAYDAAAAAFVKVAVSEVLCADERLFVIEVLRTAVKISFDIKAIPLPDYMPLRNIDKSEENSLKVVLQALQSLAPEDRLIVLLRDQLHLSHKDIAYISDTPETDVLIRLERSREELRNRMMEILDRGI